MTKVRVSWWYGKVEEVETASVAIKLVELYPEFATEDQNENGWLVWEEFAERYAGAKRVEVFNVHADLVCTIEEITE